jgi:hypothetical protein
MSATSNSGSLALWGLAAFAIWVFAFLPFYYSTSEIAWSVPTVAAIAASVSAIFSAVSAIANVYNTRAYGRQLRNSTIDACLTAAIGLQSAIDRTITVKVNKEIDRDAIDPSEIWGAYTDAWSEWVSFAQKFQVVKRYGEAGLNMETPGELSTLLLELRGILREVDWAKRANRGRDLENQINGIQAKVYALVNDVASKLSASPV